MGREADALAFAASRPPALLNAGWLSSDVRTAFVFAISIPWTSSEHDGDDACDATPIHHALFRTAFPRRGIGGQTLPRLPASLTPGGRLGPTG